MVKLSAVVVPRAVVPRAAEKRSVAPLDDDTWIFINGVLVLVLGATHERMRGTVTLTDNGEANWALAVPHASTLADQPIPGASGSGTWSNLGIELGKTDEVAIFHADRTPVSRTSSSPSRPPRACVRSATCPKPPAQSLVMATT